MDCTLATAGVAACVTATAACGDAAPVEPDDDDDDAIGLAARALALATEAAEGGMLSSDELAAMIEGAQAMLHPQAPHSVPVRPRSAGAPTRSAGVGGAAMTAPPSATQLAHGHAHHASRTTAAGRNAAHAAHAAHAAPAAVESSVNRERAATEARTSPPRGNVGAPAARARQRAASAAKAHPSLVEYLVPVQPSWHRVAPAYRAAAASPSPKMW